MAITYSGGIITVAGTGLYSGAPIIVSGNQIYLSSKPFNAETTTDGVAYISSGPGAGQTLPIQKTTVLAGAYTILYVRGTFNPAPTTSSNIVVYYRFRDIYNADVAGGWGVTSWDNGAFQTTVPIYFGDGTTSTIFQSTDISVNSTGTKSGLTDTYRANVHFYVRNNAQARFGLLINSSTKSTSSGISFNCTSTTLDPTARQAFLVEKTSGNLGLYGCSMNNAEVLPVSCKDMTTGATVKIYNSVLSGGVFNLGTPAKNFDVFNTTINSVLGQSEAGQQGGIDNSRGNFNGGNQALYDSIGGSPTLSGSYVRDVTYFSNTYNVSSNINAVDVDSNNWTNYVLSTGPSITVTLARKWTQSWSMVSATANFKLAVFNNAGTLEHSLTSDSNGLFTSVQINEGGMYISVTGGGSAAGNSNFNFNTPHTVSWGLYGYRLFKQTRRVSILDTSKNQIKQTANGAEGLIDQVNDFIVASLGTAAAYTGITINGATSSITVSGTRTIQELYDYAQYWWQSSYSNMYYDIPFETQDGINFYLSSGWTLTVSGILSDSTKTILDKGTVLTISSGGSFADSDGAVWESGGSTYYGSPIDYVVKVGGTPIVGAEVAHFDSSLNNLTYNSSFTSVTSLTTDGSGAVSGYAVWKIDATTYSSQNVVVRRYEYYNLSIPKTLDGTPINEDILMTANPFIVDTYSNVSAYTGISIDSGTETFTVTSDHTHTEMYDYTQYWFSLAANMSETVNPITTSDGTTQLYADNWDLVVDGANVELDEEAKEVVLQGTGALSITNGAFFEDKTAVIWDDLTNIYYASHAWLKVVDGVTALPIQNAAIGFGDVTTQTKLMYDLTLTQTGLLTDASGLAEGYLVYKINSTTYGNTKMVVAEYDYDFLTIPRTITGAAIGSAMTPEVSRLNTDGQVTLTKATAALVSGVTITHASKTVDMGDNTLPDVYDYIKYKQSSIVDIETGIPGCLSYCIYGQLLEKSGTNFTAIDDWLYQNVGNGGKLINGTMELDTTGISAINTDDVDLDFSVAGTYDLRTSTISTATIDLTNSSAGAVTVKLAPSVNYTNTGPSITVQASTAITIAATNLIDGTRYQFYNVTQAAELDNGLVSGGSGASYAATLGLGEEVEDGDVIRLRATYVSGSSAAKTEIETTGVASTSGVTFVNTQTNDTVYTSWALDGSAITEFSTDYVNIQVDVNDPDGETTKKRLGAWLKYIVTTADGIRNFFGAVTTVSVADIKINNSVVDLQLDNVAGSEVYFTDIDVRLYRSDLGQIIASGSDSIFLDYSGVPFVIETGVSGLTAGESAKLDTIASVDTKLDKTLTTAKFIALKD